jgi:uncharacterized protein (DUF4415 family)
MKKDPKCKQKNEPQLTE